MVASDIHMSVHYELLPYKTILKPIWTYGIQLWGTASTTNIEILERFQSKALRMIVDAPWYDPNTFIRKDLHCPTVRLNAPLQLTLWCSPPHPTQSSRSEPSWAACAGICLMSCLPDSNVPFLIVIFSF
jgi:hypothetical protein